MSEKFGEQEEVPIYDEYTDLPTVEKIKPPKKFKNQKGKPVQAISGVGVELKEKEMEDENDAEVMNGEVKDPTTKRIIDALLAGNISRVIKIRKKSKEPEVLFSDPEIQAAAGKLLSKHISKGNISLQMFKGFNLPRQIILDACEEGLEANTWILKQKADLVKKEFDLPEDLILRVAEKKLPEIISSSHYRDFKDVNEFLEKYHFSPDVVLQAAQKAMVLALSSGSIRNMNAIMDKFKVPQPVTQTDEFLDAAEQGMIKLISEGNLENTKQINDQLSVVPSSSFGASTPGFFASEEFKQAAEKGIIRTISWYGDIEKAVKIKEEFRLPEMADSKEFRDAKEHGMILNLSKGKVTEAVRIKNEYGLSDKSIAIVDESAAQYFTKEYFAQNSNKDALIKYITSLGDQEVVALFPETINNVLGLLAQEMGSNEDLADYFNENLGKYYEQPWAVSMMTSAVTHYSVANKFIGKMGHQLEPWEKMAEYQPVILKAKAIVKQHLIDQESEKHGSKGFNEIDPYENDPNLFKGDQIRMASLLAKTIDPHGEGGVLESNDLAKELGLSTPADGGMNREIFELQEEVSGAYQDFLERVQSSPSINEEDKKALFEPESVNMISLEENVRSFVARYVVQELKGDLTKLRESKILINIDSILEEGFNKYIKVLKIDVPLYDKLYEEFDTLRETGRNPLEVYLGRDGIYAYVGRKAQDVSRRRKMGWEERKRQKEMGEVIEINPQYTVYPRYFRDNINYETKREFLEQERISPESDPLFYDTGYTGTIPEQIMQVMGFDQEDIEKRIRLLSAPSANRRVKGVPENARSEIIEYIEHNVKTENSAEGLIKDEKTGKIRHIAKPTSPEEQFHFMMVRQAISRHYWLQEKLHHEASGNMNIDSEHYTIRIREEYAKLLPEQFVQNPKEFFAQHGDLLKGSKGEGEFPDEEVVLFKLLDDTEIVAKRIELKKAKEARKEFSILIAAKKAGLPTAEPVGFISGKEDKDSSYLLMKKLEGISGRNFDKYLEGLGKFSVDQMKDIMKDIAEKNKEMAQLFRETLKIDKRWRIKDTIIEFNEETGEVGNVIPIDWERAKDYDPSSPKEIDEIN